MARRQGSLKEVYTFIKHMGKILRKVFRPEQFEMTWRMRTNEELKILFKEKNLVRTTKHQTEDGWDLRRGWRVIEIERVVYIVTREGIVNRAGGRIR